MPIARSADLERLVQKAMGTGGASPRSSSMRSWKLQFAHHCESPVTIERHGRPERKGRGSVILGPGKGYHMTVELEVPCRKCRTCLRRKAAHWRLRLQAEALAGVRTWFGTLTLNPESRTVLRARARVRIAKQGLDFDSLPPEERFRLYDAEAQKEITKYLKRVRKNSGGAPLRFMCVTEAHKSGEPHWHMIVHEKSPDQPVRHKVLKGAWRLGFTHWRLADTTNELTYVTKYLTKSDMARVRASVRYGLGSGNQPATSIDGEGKP